MQARQQRETAFSGTAAWSSGKKAGAAALLALLAALLLNLGMPGLGKYSGWWPLLCLCLSPLLLIALSVPLRPAQAAAAGFLFGLAAYTGGASVMRGVARVTFWGALAMAITAGVGMVFGAS